MTTRTPDQRDATPMRAALALAARGPVADPNPRVGAVICDASGRVLGQGFHRGAGTPHAEVVALRAAGPAARGATAVVTLEPCAHQGRTAPCVDALLAAGIARVVYAQGDPSPGAGGGGGRLADAGVTVVGGVLADEAEALNEAWTFAIRQGRPRVTWKAASTLDGRAAAKDGTSQWITGPLARADVHALRAACGAVLVGTGTVLADDPRLTARRPDGSLYERQPLRVVVGRRPIPARARVLDSAARTLHLTQHDPAAVLDALWARGIRHVLVDGGPTVAAAFLRAGLVDDVVVYLAPALLGAGRFTVGDLGVGTVAQALRLVVRDVTTVGADIRVRAGIAPAAAGRESA